MVPPPKFAPAGLRTASWRQRHEPVFVNVFFGSRIGARPVPLEQEIESLRNEGALDRAATKAIECYGPEVLGFLVTVLRHEHDANEVFSQACEDLWRGMAGFEGRCSMRTWLYTLARHAAVRFRRSPDRRPARRAALSEAADVAERVRTVTHQYLRTTVKDQFSAIRDSLDEEDRALLVLRVDRKMSWREIARNTAAPDDSDDALHRAEGRLRKRFQNVKEEIRSRALAGGLVRDRKHDRK